MAILLVISHNVQLIDTGSMHGWLKWSQWLLNFGWVGVSLFFALSGFLITNILLSELGTPNFLGKFIARRTLRIFPLYYLTLFFILILLPHLEIQPAIYKYDTINSTPLWFYLSNWTVANHMNETNLPHFWSLAVEEQFYLIWPILIFFLRTPKKVLTISLLLSMVSLASRTYLWMQVDAHDINYYWTHCRMDGLTLGAAAAAYWSWPDARHWIQARARQIQISTFILFIVGGLITRGYPRTSFLGQTLGYTILAICFASIVFLLATRDQIHAESNKNQSNKIWSNILQSLGKYSYAMYVFHKPLHDVFSLTILQALGIQPAGNLLYTSLHIATVTAASYLMARLSYILIEQHFLKLKARFA